MNNILVAIILEIWYNKEKSGLETVRCVVKEVFLMVDMEKIVSPEQLSEDKKELAKIIGLEAYKKLVQHFGGSYIYVNKPDTVTRKERDAEIFRKFDDKNYCQLAQEYNLTENRIRSIIRQKEVIS